MGSEYADHPSAAAIKAAGSYPGIDEMPAFRPCTRCGEDSLTLQSCGCYCCPCGETVRADDCLRETWQRLQGQRDMLAKVLRRIRRWRDAERGRARRATSVDYIAACNIGARYQDDTARLLAAELRPGKGGEHA